MHQRQRLCWRFQGLPRSIVAGERDITEGRVSRADDVVKQRAIAKGVVAGSVHAEKHRVSTDGIVEVACSAGKQRECSARGVVNARGVG